MKKALALTAFLALCTGFTGCSAAPASSAESVVEPVGESSAESGGNSIVESDSESGSENSSIPAILTDNENPPLTAGSFTDSEGTGIPQSYEELQDFISPFSEVNFLGLEIVRRYSPEEAYEATDDDIYLYGSTLYDIHITYDYLNAQPLDINTKLCSAGTAEKQHEGYPPYSEGDKFAGFLLQFDPDDVNVKFPELLFAVDDSADPPVGYHVGFDEIDFTDKDGNSIGDSDFTATAVVTTTSNNPVTYTDRIPMDALTDFLRNDWTERGYELNTPLN